MRYASKMLFFFVALLSLSISLPLSSETFTGKVIRNKVRLRLQPSLEGTIVRELDRGELLLITGEADEFYLVRPPEDIKAYIFRTFVLDGKVEGNHVNIRLSPDLEAPVIAQLNSGRPIQGVISALNSKWLEIEPPESANFYVCKEFIENIGGPNKLVELRKKAQEIQLLLEQTEKFCHAELQKPYTEVQLEKAIEKLNLAIQQYSDFPEHIAKAKTLLNFILDCYLQKKLSFLEIKKQPEIQKEGSSIQNLEMIKVSEQEPTLAVDGKFALWVPIEMKFFEAWAKEQPKTTSIHDFYEHQKKQAVLLTGILEPYGRPIRNKPGDFILINRHNRLASAYLYSTAVDLHDKIGQEIKIMAVPRPNNNFAHPTYFVLSAE
jgi:hypothetical protein